MHKNLKTILFADGRSINSRKFRIFYWVAVSRLNTPALLLLDIKRTDKARTILQSGKIPFILIVFPK